MEQFVQWMFIRFQIVVLLVSMDQQQQVYRDINRFHFIQIILKPLNSLMMLFILTVKLLVPIVAMALRKDFLRQNRLLVKWQEFQVLTQQLFEKRIWLDKVKQWGLIIMRLQKHAPQTNVWSMLKNFLIGKTNQKYVFQKTVKLEVLEQPWLCKDLVFQGLMLVPPH